MSTQTLNSLANASSYLRSAIHQPTRWQEWGEETFEEAKWENKPILLDTELPHLRSRTLPIA